MKIPVYNIHKTKGGEFFIYLDDELVGNRATMKQILHRINEHAEFKGFRKWESNMVEGMPL